jgi:hypothetical protein
MPVTIAFVMAIVAGAIVWLVWSLVENFSAARRAKKTVVATAPQEDKPAS